MFSAYIRRNTVRASSNIPPSIRYFGLSGKVQSQQPIIRLGIEQRATKRFHDRKTKYELMNSISRGMITQAIPKIYEFVMIFRVELGYQPGRAIIPTVQNSSNQHRIFSRCLVGWNSPRYGNKIPMAPVILKSGNIIN